MLKMTQRPNRTQCSVDPIATMPRARRPSGGPLKASQHAAIDTNQHCIRGTPHSSTDISHLHRSDPMSLIDRRHRGDLREGHQRRRGPIPLRAAVTHYTRTTFCTLGSSESSPRSTCRRPLGGPPQLRRLGGRASPTGIGAARRAFYRPIVPSNRALSRGGITRVPCLYV